MRVHLIGGDKVGEGLTDRRGKCRCGEAQVSIEFSNDCKRDDDDPAQRDHGIGCEGRMVISRTRRVFRSDVEQRPPGCCGLPATCSTSNSSSASQAHSLLLFSFSWYTVSSWSHKSTLHSSWTESLSISESRGIILTGFRVERKCSSRRARVSEGGWSRS